MNDRESIERAFRVAHSIFAATCIIVGIWWGARIEERKSWKEGFRYGILMYREADLDEDVNYVRWQKEGSK